MLAQISLGFATFNEVPDLAPNRAHHFQQLVIALQNRACEKFEDTDDFAFNLYRESKTAVQSSRRGRSATGKIAIESNVVDPGRFPTLPNATRQPDALRTSQLSGPGFKFLCIDYVAIPEVRAAEHVIMLENRPDRTCIPI